MSSMINPMGFASETNLRALHSLKSTTEDAVGHRLEDERIRRGQQEVDGAPGVEANEQPS
jgi:hypothetical protein